MEVSRLQVAFEATGQDKVQQALKQTDAGISKLASNSEHSATRMGGAFSGMGKALAVGFGAVVTKQLVDVGKGFVNSASDWNESVGKSSQVFGAQSKDMANWAKGGAQAFGLNQNAALETASTFGNLFEGLGVGQKEAAGMSKGIVGLGADLSSFNNIPVDQVLQDIQSGLLGEAEPLRKYGILLDEATVQQKALTMTGKANAKQLTQQDKLLARQALIYEQTGNAQGDFARTSKGLANQSRILKAQISNLGTELGGKLLPITLKATDAANRFLDRFNDKRAQGFSVWESGLRSLHTTLDQVFGKRAGDAIDATIRGISGAIGTVGAAIGNLAGDLAAGDFGAFFSDLGSNIKDLAINVKDVAVNVGNWVVGVIPDIWSWLKGVLGVKGAGFAAVGDGTQSTEPITVTDVIVNVGELVLGTISGWAADITSTIQTWIDSNKPGSFITAVDLTDFTVAFGAGADGNWGEAIKGLLTADAIKITPQIELNITEGVANWVRGLGTGATTIDWGNIALGAAVVTGLGVALFFGWPAALAAFVAVTLGPDIIKAVGSAFKGIWQGLFETVSQPWTPGSSPSSVGVETPGLFTQLSDNILGWFQDMADNITGWWADNDPFSGLGDTIGGAFTTAIDAAGTWISTHIPDWMRKLAAGDVTGAINAFFGGSASTTGATSGFDPTGGTSAGISWGGAYSGPGFGPGVDPATGRDDPTMPGASGAVIPVTGSFSTFIVPPDALAGVQSSIDAVIKSAPFTATFDIDTGPAAQKYTDAYTWGTVWDAASFSSIFDIDNGPAALKYTDAFTWGEAWAGTVFTASFDVDTSGITNAVAIARQAAADIAAVMPHSPAKEGPLKEPITFDYIADNMKQTMGRLKNYAYAGMSAVSDSMGVGGPSYAGRASRGAGAGTVIHNHHYYDMTGALVGRGAQSEIRQMVADGVAVEVPRRLSSTQRAGR